MRSKSLVTVVLFYSYLILSALAQNSLDESFNPGSGVNGFIESAIVQPDGNILICGNFTEVNGEPRQHIARLHSNGSVDLSFNADPSYWVRYMVLQPDGKIVIGGFFTSVSGVPRNRIARLNHDGSLDSSFNPGSGCEGKIVPVDPTDPFVFSMGLQSDGKIVIGGNFTHYNGVARSGVARLNNDGSLDTSFGVGSGVDSWVRTILILPNSQILLGGWFESYNNRPFNRMVRLNPNGTADTSFNPYLGDKTAVYTIARISGGKYIVGGHSVNPSAPFRQEIVRLNSDGSYDTTFNSGGSGADEKVESLLVQPDGKIVLVGYFTHYNGIDRRGIARLNPDGSLDDTLLASADNWLWTVVQQPDGRLIVCGGMHSINGISRNGIARLGSAGNLDFLHETAAVGSLAGWYMNGTNFNASAVLKEAKPVDLNWQLAGSGDFNGDGQPDLLWQHTDGRIAVWLMNGTTLTEAVLVHTAVSGWRAVAAGDMDGDGKPDILLRNADGRVAVWLMNGTSVAQAVLLRDGKQMPNSWQVVGLKDLNGDGKADIIWQNTNWQVAVWLMNGPEFLGSEVVRDGQPALNWKVIGAADFNYDGQNDLVFQNANTGVIAVWFLNGTSFQRAALFAQQPPNTRWKLSGLTGFNRSRQSDLIWRYLP